MPLTRCSSVNPYGTRCALSQTHVGDHVGWIGEASRTWPSTPQGPQTEDEFTAAAWHLTSLIGFTVSAEEDREWGLALVIDGDDMRKWWDEQGTSVMAAWKATTAPVDVHQTNLAVYATEAQRGVEILRSSRERLEDAEVTGSLVEPGFCPIVDCGCDGVAHP